MLQHQSTIRPIVLLFSLCLLFVFQTSAQTAPPQTDSVYTIEQGNLKMRFANDARLTASTILKTYAQPVKWKKRDWLYLGGSLGIAGAFMLVDEDIDDFFARNQRSVYSDISSVGDFMGQPEHNYPFMITLWGTGVLFKSEALRDTGIMLFASVTTSGILQTFGKSIVGRARPQTGEGAHSFKPFGRGGGAAYHSFPSGHTMLALANAWILARQVNPLGLKILFYSVPVVVGTSRVYDRKHFASDVLLGSALGIACAEAVLRIYPTLKKKLAEKQNRLTFAPAPTGMSMRLSF